MGSQRLNTTDVFVWKAVLLMSLALAQRSCGGEGRLGGKRRENDQMWAYGMTSVQEKQRCLQTKVGRLNV